MTGEGGRLRIGDFDVLRIGLGTNRLTRAKPDRAFLRAAVAEGLNFIDTAHRYSGGESEAAIGEALSPFPEGCLVATKGGFESGHGRPEVLRRELEESLRRLRTDYVPLYYLHRVDPETPLEESLAAIRGFRDSGMIRHVGLSEVSVEQIELASQIVPITAVQNHYNLSVRTHDAVVDYCEAHGIAFVPFFPLRGEAPPALAAIAAAHGSTPEQVALAWLLRRSRAMLPIPGTLSIDHLRENLRAVSLSLSEGELQSLA